MVAYFETHNLKLSDNDNSFLYLSTCSFNIYVLFHLMQNYSGTSAIKNLRQKSPL